MNPASDGINVTHLQLKLIKLIKIQPYYTSFMLFFKFLRSNTSLSFSSFSSFATNPAGEIHSVHSFAGILSITPCLMSFCTSFFTFSFQCKGFLQGLQAKNGFDPGSNSTSIGGYLTTFSLSNSYTRTSSNSLHKP